MKPHNEVIRLDRRDKPSGRGYGTRHRRISKATCILALTAALWGLVLGVALFVLP